MELNPLNQSLYISIAVMAAALLTVNMRVPAVA